MCEALTREEEAANWVLLGSRCPCESTGTIKVCLACRREFVEDRIDEHWIEALGHDRLNFCPLCLNNAFLSSPGQGNMAKKRVLTFIQELAQVLGHAPYHLHVQPQEMADLNDLERLALLQMLLERKPSFKRVNKLFGSWRDALVQAGLSPHEAREAKRKLDRRIANENQRRKDEDRQRNPDREKFRHGFDESRYDVSRCENPYILKWWTPEHDALIAKHIDEYEWFWGHKLTDELVALAEKDVESWKSEDPLCRRWAWYNILLNFAVARAIKIGLTDRIREPQWRNCALCGKQFPEDSISFELFKALGGVNGLDFCLSCLDAAFVDRGRDDLPREETLDFLRDLAGVLQRIPNQPNPIYRQDYPVNLLVDLSVQKRSELLIVLYRKPTLERVKDHFGSWLNALIQAGVLPDGTRRTARGTHCVAEDGHVCLSLGEKTIDDLLYRNGIQHEKEPYYPGSRYRADFAVGKVFIEFFGLTGNASYDARTKLKQELCEKHGIKLISIYPVDLVSQKKLEGKLLRKLIA